MAGDEEGSQDRAMSEAREDTDHTIFGPSLLNACVCCHGHKS